MAHLPEIRVYQVAPREFASRPKPAVPFGAYCRPPATPLVALLVSWGELVMLVLGPVERRTAAQGDIRRLQVQ